MYNLVLKGERVTLPNLISKTLEEAKLELSKKRLSVRVKDIIFNNKWKKGKIVLQEPSSGSKVKINKVVKVVLSAGSEMVIVPDLENKTIESATQILKEVGLIKGIISHVYTPRYAAGKIITQQPIPLEKTGRISPVNLLVSRGRREPKYLMPDLIGKKAETVMAKLKEMEFKVGAVHYSYYHGLEPGIIITQLPLPGHSIQKNNLITLEISKE